MRRFTEGDDDSFPWELVQREVARLEDEKRALRETIDEIDRQIARQTATAGQLAALDDYCARVRANLETFDFERKRLALEAFNVRVTANGRAYDLDGSVPTDAGVLSQTSECCGHQRPPPPAPA